MPSRQLQVATNKSLFDEVIDRHAEAYLAAYPEIKEFSRFEKSGTINYYIGMICVNEFERIDTTQVRIRGSLSLTNNRMVELDLSSTKQPFSFFPGQIVAFSGDPFIKRQLTVRNFLDPSKIAPKLKKINNDQEIKLIISSGPYMDVEHDDWTLVDKLIETVKSNEATHIIMLGPFVDMENKLIRSQHDENWKILFGKLMEGLYNIKCEIFMVPSMMRDILPADLSSNYFYPTEGFAIDINLRQGASPNCSIKSVADPSQIDLGGIYVDVTSAEVLFHLHKSTAFINRGQSNVFESLFRHTITHGIYPIYPPPSNEIAIDYPSLSSMTKLDRLAPHVVVLPTRFTTSVTNIDNRLVVAVHKCSVKKHVVLIHIPRIESSEEKPIDSLFDVDISHKILALIENELAVVKMEMKEEVVSPKKDGALSSQVKSEPEDDKKSIVHMETNEFTTDQLKIALDGPSPLEANNKTTD